MTTREIKFRAWDKFKEEMSFKVMVGNTNTEDANYTCNSIFCKERKRWVHADHHCIIVMQFTGLKDKTGVEIYEGDIIETPNGFIGKVVFKKHEYLTKRSLYQCTGWVFERKDGHCEFLDFSILAGKVIGNVNQNPELLQP